MTELPKVGILMFALGVDISNPIVKFWEELQSLMGTVLSLQKGVGAYFSYYLHIFSFYWAWRKEGCVCDTVWCRPPIRDMYRGDTAADRAGLATWVRLVSHPSQCSSPVAAKYFGRREKGACESSSSNIWDLCAFPAGS